MRTSEFYDLIQLHSDKVVRFRDHQGKLIPAAYHVTEIKSASYQTLDCGEMVHDWEETILQLWLSKEVEGEEAMSARKLKGIFSKVSQKIGLFPEAEIRIEYGNTDFPPISFHIEETKVASDVLIISLRAPVTTCKLEDRGGSCSRPETKASSCCSGGSCD